MNRGWAANQLKFAETLKVSKLNAGSRAVRKIAR
jgi:hypothetical protein